MRRAKVAGDKNRLHDKKWQYRPKEPMRVAREGPDYQQCQVRTNVNTIRLAFEAAHRRAGNTEYSDDVRERSQVRRMQQQDFRKTRTQSGNLLHKYSH